MVLVIFRRRENKMKRLLMLCCLVLAGCGEPSGEDQSLDEIIEQVNASGTMTDEQVESLSKAWNHYLKGKSSITDKQNKILEEKRDLDAQWGLLIEEDRVEWLDLCGLTSITDKQAESLSKVGSPIDLCGLTALSDEQAKSLSRLKGLALDGLTTIPDDQAESLSEVPILILDGLTSITEEQAENLSEVGVLHLNGLTSITDAQAENLSRVAEKLFLNGLIAITNEQAKSLSKVGFLEISEACLPLIDKYKNQ